MKNLIIIILLIFVSLKSFSQENVDLKPVEINFSNNDTIIKATPANGIDNFKAEFAKALTLSTERILEINLRQIKIIVSLNIDASGKITNAKVINDKYNLTPEINETFALLPNWIPAKENGVNTSSIYTLPIGLNLGLPDYELDENRIPKIALQKADFDAFHYEFNSFMIYPRDFYNRYYYKKGSYDSGNTNTSNVFKYEVKFIVNEKGEFEDIQTFINGKYDSYLNASVKKALKQCAPWEPATVNGEKVKSSFTYPVQLNIKK